MAHGSESARVRSEHGLQRVCRRPDPRSEGCAGSEADLIVSTHENTNRPASAREVSFGERKRRKSRTNPYSARASSFPFLERKTEKAANLAPVRAPLAPASASPEPCFDSNGEPRLISTLASWNTTLASPARGQVPGPATSRRSARAVSARRERALFPCVAYRRGRWMMFGPDCALLGVLSRQHPGAIGRRSRSSER